MRMNSKNTTPVHIIAKLLKTKDTEKTLVTSRGKRMHKKEQLFKLQLSSQQK